MLESGGSEGICRRRWYDGEVGVDLAVGGVVMDRGRESEEVAVEDAWVLLSLPFAVSIDLRERRKERAEEGLLAVVGVRVSEEEEEEAEEEEEEEEKEKGDDNEGTTVVAVLLLGMAEGDSVGRK